MSVISEDELDFGAWDEEPDAPDPLYVEIECSQWQPITRTPTAGVKVLAYWDGVVLEATRLPSGRWTPEVPFVSHESAPSHWMPLPAPPAIQPRGTNAKA